MHKDPNMGSNISLCSSFIAKKKLKLTHTLYEISHYISVAPFEKRAIREVYLNNENQDVKEQNCIQLKSYN
jgi:hypothetical protein